MQPPVMILLWRNISTVSDPGQRRRRSETLATTPALFVRGTGPDAALTDPSRHERTGRDERFVRARDVLPALHARLYALAAMSGDALDILGPGFEYGVEQMAG